MKNVLFYFLMLLCTTLFSQRNTSNISYSSFLKIPGKVLENIGSNDIPTYVTKTSKGLKLGKKYRFVILGNHSLVVTAEYATAEYENDYQTFFAIVSKSRKADGSMFVTYCSCGSNTSVSEGDGCFYGKDGEGTPTCTGGCYGPENTGKNCSFTQVHYPPVGSVASPRAREVSF